MCAVARDEFCKFLPTDIKQITPCDDYIRKKNVRKKIT